MKSIIKKLLLESAETKVNAANTLAAGIEKAAKAIINSYKNNGKLILFGNGGSAADAQHVQAELTHQFEIKNRKCLLAIALTTNTSVITAIGNDWDFSEVFQRQVEGLAASNDVILAITTSGNSINIIKGVEQAKKNGAYTIVLSGKDGGKIKSIADLNIVIPSDNTARIQEAHITIGHILCHLIEQELFNKK